MTEYLIGTGGWAYFKIPNKRSLKAYSEHFNFVEVNHTFYEHPDSRMVERWRRTVPEDFVFSVRCHQELTHRVGLKPVDQAYAAFSKMIGICKMLEAPLLHLLTPPSYLFDDEEIGQARDFLSSVSLNGVHLAWEVRSTVNEKLISLMKDFNIIHSVDLSRETPKVESEVIYTRLFGKGKHNVYQFTDDEMEQIDKKVRDANAKRAVVTWHGVRMTSDAARFKKYKETGNFVPITAYTGVDSAKAVLEEDTKCPLTKAELIKNQGWKVIDLTADRRIHLSDLLKRLPEKTYNDVDEIARELEIVI